MLRNNWLLFAALLAAGCSSSTPAASTGNQNQGDDDSGAGTSSGGSDDSGIGNPVKAQDSGTSSGGGNDSGTGSSSGGTDAAPATTTVTLPFFVSDQFVPTGFMGDSTASMSAITLAHDTATCKSPREPSAGGDCYSATWAPTVGDAGSAWAGVYWQSPANNWGSKPGKPIAAGAKSVSFYAAGAVGGEVIQLCAGGINASGATPALPYSDSFTVKQPPITLTTSWTQYTFSLEGTSYTDVLGGFCWVASATGSESVTFYIDDIQWQ